MYKSVLFNQNRIGRLPRVFRCNWTGTWAFSNTKTFTKQNAQFKFYYSTPIWVGLRSNITTLCQTNTISRTQYLQFLPHTNCYKILQINSIVLFCQLIRVYRVIEGNEQGVERSLSSIWFYYLSIMNAQVWRLLRLHYADCITWKHAVKSPSKSMHGKL